MMMLVVEVLQDESIRGLFAFLGPFGAMLLLGSAAVLVVPLLAWGGPAERPWRAADEHDPRREPID
jgi:hypothetical protein